MAESWDAFHLVKISGPTSEKCKLLESMNILDIFQKTLGQQ